MNMSETVELLEKLKESQQKVAEPEQLLAEWPASQPLHAVKPSLPKTRGPSLGSRRSAPTSSRQHGLCSTGIYLAETQFHWKSGSFSDLYSEFSDFCYEMGKNSWKLVLSMIVIIVLGMVLLHSPFIGGTVSQSRSVFFLDFKQSGRVLVGSTACRSSSGRTNELLE